jgi:hypothetical protein
MRKFLRPIKYRVDYPYKPLPPLPPRNLTRLLYRISSTPRNYKHAHLRDGIFRKANFPDRIRYRLEELDSWNN